VNRFVQPSFIGLQTANDFFGIRANPLEESRHLLSREPTRPTYWEVGVTHHFFGDRLGFPEDNEAHGERIEGRHEIMQDIPDNAAEFGRYLSCDAKPVDFDRWFRIFIHHNGVWVATAKKIEKSLKICKVLIGPVDLYPAT